MATDDRLIEDIKREIGPLPDGFYVKEDELGNILIGNDQLAFAITKLSIRDGCAVFQAKAMWPELLAAVKDCETYKAAP